MSAAETFRGKHPDIPVRILTVDPALPYAKPPLSKGFLRGREDMRDLNSEGWFAHHNVDLIRGITVNRIDTGGVETALVAAEVVPLQRRFGLEAGERVVKILSDHGVGFVGETTATDSPSGTRPTATWSVC